MNQTLSNSAATATRAPDVRDQLAKLLRAKVARDAIYPLAPAQLSMWFHQHMEKDSSSFNMPFAFCIRGDRLDADIVHQALAALVARHAVLRTVFEMDNEDVVQRVKPTLAFTLPLRDVSGTIGENWQAEVVAMSKALSTGAFDLQRGPLFRFELVRISGDLHVLLATFHHIVMDGWSVGVFLGDFAKAYMACRDTGAAPAWTPLPVSYGDYARQRQVAAAQPDAVRAIDYWRARLKDAPEALSLPADFARPAVQTFNGAIHELALPLGLKQQMTELARDNGATFFMLSLAAFYVLMGRLSGQWDMILGVASANRNQAEHRGLLGLFSEILPMRAAIDQNLSFLDFLETVKRDCLDDYEHAAPALTDLVEAMNGNRDARRSNLFQVGFDYQNTPWPALGDVITLLHGDTGAAKLDLNLNLSTGVSGMLAQFEYNTDLFSAEAMAVFAGCFETLLGSIVRDPYTALASLKITAPAPFPPLAKVQASGHVLELIESRAAATPHAVAVIDAAGPVTYDTLMGRANALAWTLRDRGAGPNTLVGLCCERSTDMIVALLAILKAGAAYVPMDAGFPLARLQYIVADAGLDLVITRQDQLAALAGLDGVELIAETGAARADTPPLHLAGTDLAYVLYTSGTTGQPKGVMVSHGALRHFVVPAIERLALEAGDTMLQFASISFDASVEEIFPSLASGATLLMRGPGMIGSVDAFLAMCEQHNVTVLDLPTAFWHELVDALAAADAPRLPASIRLVVIGGEAASPKMLASWLATVGRSVSLQNTYGPTETTVCVTTAELSALAFDPATSPGLPIGRANPHVQIYVLDERGVQVPAGVYGEIFIGGDTIASGYLGRAELSSQKFVVDTFRPRPGGMLFRSGDYGRVAADGSLEFKGRKDGQIKLRGFRVELGEVEAIIGGHPDVHQVCAEVHDAADESRRSLVAFVVLKDDAALTPVALRRWLAERSPDYLVPSVLQIVERFPYGVTGKIDRAALLAELVQTVPVAAQATRAPTPTEEILIGIWEGVLGVGGIGIEDNFFDRGGHSLLMIKMLSRVRRLLDADVPLAQVFEAPTVARFAERVDALRLAGHNGDAPIVRQPRVDGGTFPQSFAQQRLWFHQKLNPETASYNVPVALSARGVLAVDHFAASVEEMVARHEILRTTFSERNGQPVQCIAPAGSVKLAFTDLSALPAQQRQAELDWLTAAQASARFDLERGPMLRAAIYKLAEQDFVISFVFHHIVIDDWSMTLFMAELREIYKALVAGLPSVRREAGLQYADFSEWQREQACGESGRAQLAYWQDALAGVPDLLALPTDRPRPAFQSHAGASHSWTVDPAVANAARALARQNGVTLHMLLQSAWVATLARLSGQKDIVVGVPVANRPHSELENLIGFFVNTLPLRVQVGGDDTLMDLLGQVKKVSLASYANQSVQLERIVEAVRPQRDLGFNPLFVSMFALQNASSAEFTLGQLTLSTRDVEDRSSKVDVSMIFSEAGDKLTGTLEYAQDLYDHATMVRWSGFVNRVLEAFVANAGGALARTMLSTPDAMATLLTRVNGAGNAALHGYSLPELIVDQANRNPEAPAVVDGTDTCTYQELDERSNQLARELGSMGVTRDSIVALAIPRSIGMVVGMLAILKAGGAYLPLDVTLPARRIGYMLDDSQATLVLTDARAGDAGRDFDTAVLCLDGDAERIAAHSRTALDCWPAAHDLAYLIYTSGSTGEPKGVMIEHGSAATQIVAVREALALCPGDRMLQFASSSFDVCVQEVFGALVSGAALVLRDEACLASASAFWSFCASTQVTVVDIPTRFWHELTFDKASACPPCVRALLIGGEAVERSAVEAWFEGVGHRPRLFNMYGPTEATINASMHELTCDSAGWDSIGKPFGASVVYILDPEGQLVPPGVTGELFVGGVGVARGYLGRAELTAARFVADPFAGGTARMYASGDLASWRENGEIVYLGRADAQIKLRGFRIDLGEIEHQLNQLPVVKSALVLAHENTSGERRLVAYVTLAEVPVQSASALTASMLRELKLVLPEYMVPSGILILPQLPLTSNGKIAVDELPQMDWVVSGADYLAPGTATEVALAAIWAGLLGVPEASIGLAANFFELGGHSLLSMRLASEVRSRFEVEISLRDIFGFGRLVELAHRIDLLRLAAQMPAAVAEGQTSVAGWV